MSDKVNSAGDPLLYPQQEVFEPAREVAAPKGWTHTPLYDPFEAFLGPMFFKYDSDGLQLGLILDDRHCEDGFAAPGCLMTFADAMLGWAVWQKSLPHHCVTVSQQSNFLADANMGEFIICAPEVLRKTADFVFVKGLFCVQERPILNVSSLWKIVRAR